VLRAAGAGRGALCLAPTRAAAHARVRAPARPAPQPRLRSAFNAALNLMNCAADGAPLPAAAAAAPAAATTPAAAPEEPAAAGGGAAGGRWGGPEPTLRDLVARYADEAGYEFLPKPGRFHDGLQVYSFGGVSCVLEAATSTVRAVLPGAGDRWAPVSLERLAAEAAKRAAGRR
jgi:tuftelin-interacting protein 11